MPHRDGRLPDLLHRPVQHPGPQHPAVAGRRLPAPDPSQAARKRAGQRAGARVREVAGGRELRFYASFDFTQVNERRRANYARVRLQAGPGPMWQTSARRRSARALERPCESTGDGASSSRCARVSSPQKTACVEMRRTHAPTFCAADPSAPEQQCMFTWSRQLQAIQPRIGVCALHLLRKEK